MSNQNKVILGNMPSLPYAIEEAVNRLRVNMSFLGEDVKKIMVISTMPDEGKSCFIGGTCYNSGYMDHF